MNPLYDNFAWSTLYLITSEINVWVSVRSTNTLYQDYNVGIENKHLFLHDPVTGSSYFLSHK